MRAHLLLILIAFTLTLIAPRTMAATTYFDDPLLPITIEKDHAFSFELDRTEITGYEWRLEKPLDNKVIRFVSKEYFPKPRKNAAAGSVGRELWTFDAVGKGKTDITFEYLRPWDKKAKAERKMTIRVTVR